MQLDGYNVYFEDEGEVFASGYNIAIPSVGDEVDVAERRMIVHALVWRLDKPYPLERYNRGHCTVHVVLKDKS